MFGDSGISYSITEVYSRVKTKLVYINTWLNRNKFVVMTSILYLAWDDAVR